MKDIFKYTWFYIHRLNIHILPWMWIFNFNFLYLYFVILLSWKLNKNRCLISELEYYFFNETFMGKGKKYYVPKHHRELLFIHFLLGLMYYFFKNIFFGDNKSLNL